MAAAEARAGRRSALRPGHRPPLPPRHRACSAGGRTRRRSNARSSSSRPSCGRPRSRSCSAHDAGRSLPPSRLLAGLDYREDFISRDEERALLEQLMADGPRPIPLPRLDRQPEDAELRLALRFRRRKLPADRTHSRLAAAAARQGARGSQALRQTTSPMSSSPATIPAPASAGTRTATSSNASSVSR